MDEDLGPSRVVHIEGRELPDEDIAVPGHRRAGLVARVGYLVLGLGLFVTARWILESSSRLVGFVVVLFAVPIALILVG